MEPMGVSMQNDLVNLWKMQASIGDIGLSKGTEWMERRVRELLQHVNEFVAKYSPESYTITVGVPLGASVSFTWQGTQKQAGLMSTGMG